MSRYMNVALLVTPAVAGATFLAILLVTPPARDQARTEWQAPRKLSNYSGFYALAAGGRTTVKITPIPRSRANLIGLGTCFLARLYSRFRYIGAGTGR